MKAVIIFIKECTICGIRIGRVTTIVRAVKNFEFKKQKEGCILDMFSKVS